MHPLLADRQRWQLFLGGRRIVDKTMSFLSRALLGTGWIASALFGVPLGLAAGPISLSAWYICRAMPLGTTPSVRVVTPAVVLTMLVGVGALTYLLALVITYLIDAFEASAAASRRALEFEVAQRDAELAALRAQLDPHFLFNSLNSISGLITVSPDRARVMCQMLGEFLRDCLRLGGTPRIALEREI